MNGLKLTIKPTIERVTLKVTGVHAGKIAPPGKIFYLLECKFKKMSYKAVYTLDRSSLDKEQEDRYKLKVKKGFLNDVIDKYKLDIPTASK